MLYYLLFNFMLVIGGCFLPWLHSALFVVRLRGIDMVDGKVMLALALVGFFVLLYQCITKKEWGGGFYGAIGVALVAITGLDLYTFYKNNYPIGPGIYISFLGGVQIVGGSLLSKIKK